MITAAGLFFLWLFFGAAAAGGSVYSVLLFVDWQVTRSERLPFDYVPASHVPRHGKGASVARLPIAPIGEVS